MTLDKGFLVDLSLIALDGLAGLTLAFSLFAQPVRFSQFYLALSVGCCRTRYRLCIDCIRTSLFAWFSGFIIGYMQNKSSPGRSASLLS